MLVLRRRAGQSILIGDDIEIEIIESGPARVKVGVHAPRAVSVQRKETKLVRDRNLAAAALPPFLRDAIATHIRAAQNIVQNPSTPADKDFEARYSGHPEEGRTRARQDAGMYP